MEEWKIVGQVGSVIKNKNTFIVHIAKNKFRKDYTTGQSTKLYTVWFTCICFFEVSISTGDTVMVGGEFIPSKNTNFPFIMKISHIGIIKKKSNFEKDVIEAGSEESIDDSFYKFDYDEKNYQEYLENIN